MTMPREMKCARERPARLKRKDVWCESKGRCKPNAAKFKVRGVANDSHDFHSTRRVDVERASLTRCGCRARRTEIQGALRHVSCRRPGAEEDVCPFERHRRPQSRIH